MHIKSDELEKIEWGPFWLSGSPVINTQGNVVGVLSDTVSWKDGFFYGLIISFFPPEIK